MLAEERLYRTADGRLVVAGDPDAAELAYPVGAKVSKADEQLLAAAATEQEQPADEPPPADGQETDVPTEQPVDEQPPEPEPTPAPTTKRRAKPADKAAKPAGDK